MRSLSLNKIAQDLKVALTGRFELPIAGYAVDSRAVQPGQLFFALQGERVDAHTFLDQVAAAGASAAVVDCSYRGPDFGMALLPVENVLAALQTLARLTLAHCRPRVIAITGSVGKTTTKEFLFTLLSSTFRTAASPGNQNSQIGLPLTILNHTDGTEAVLILEMGMTLPGHISQLLTIAPPDIALITTVALVHAGNFSSLEAIARAKGEIFTSPQTSLGILPREVCAFDELSQMGSCRKLTYTVTHKDADYRVVANGKALNVLTVGHQQSIGSCIVPGAHNLHNLLAAISVAKELGVTWEAICATMPTLRLPERRLQTVEKRGILFVNDSYNAPPIGVQAALSSLPEPRAGGRRIAVLGPMPELGQFSDLCHRQVGEHALGTVDQMFCLGSECQPIYEVWTLAGRPVNWFIEKADLVATLQMVLREGDVVLIKGANGKQMWQLLDHWE